MLGVRQASVSRWGSGAAPVAHQPHLSVAGTRVCSRQSAAVLEPFVVGCSRVRWLQGTMLVKTLPRVAVYCQVLEG